MEDLSVSCDCYQLSSPLGADHRRRRDIFLSKPENCQRCLLLLHGHVSLICSLVFLSVSVCLSVCMYVCLSVCWRGFIAEIEWAACGVRACGWLSWQCQYRSRAAQEATATGMYSMCCVYDHSDRITVLNECLDCLCLHVHVHLLWTSGEWCVCVSVTCGLGSLVCCVYACVCWCVCVCSA